MPLAIVNPLKKRRSTRRKSSTSRRKVKRNPIGNLGAFAKKRRSSSRRRASTRRKSAARASAPVARRTRRRSSRRRSSGIVGSVARVASSGVGGLMQQAAPAAIGALGALAVDVGWGYLPIPLSLRVGPLAVVTRAGAAVGIGIVAGMIGGKKFGREAMLGALTVTAFDVVKGALKNNTSLPLSFYGGGSPLTALPYGAAPLGLGFFPGDGEGTGAPMIIDPEGYAFDEYGGVAATY